ncbi:MAG: glycosyltransferase [bacterium]|nr:glycosyltransferase [bacterium]
MKIALVHEFLNQLGGAERVLQNFLEIWPDATLHSLIYDQQKTKGIFDAYHRRMSFIDKLPLAHSHHRWLLPFMPWSVERFKFQDFDVVISDSSSFSKGVNTKGKLHICYCHTPTRFLWTEYASYLEVQKVPRLVKLIAHPVLRMVRNWDYRAAQKPDFFIANSINVQNRIKKFYNRDSVVIPPPVDTAMFYPQGEKQDYFFSASRLEPYKKIDLVVRAFNDSGLKLKVAGTGTMLEDLKKFAKPNIEFLGKISDDELRHNYSESRAFIFPAEEDAGIMVLEAQACGTPVIAYRAGGALETVKEGVTGEFFDQQTSDSLKQVIGKFNTAKYNSDQIRENALKYDKKIFQKKIVDFVESKYLEFNRS